MVKSLICTKGNHLFLPTNRDDIWIELSIRIRFVPFTFDAHSFCNTDQPAAHLLSLPASICDCVCAVFGPFPKLLLDLPKHFDARNRLYKSSRNMSFHEQPVPITVFCDRLRPIFGISATLKHALRYFVQNDLTEP